MNFKLVSLIVFLTITETCLAQRSELEVLDVELSNCEGLKNLDRIQNRIIQQSIKSDTFYISIGTIANCAGISEVKAFLNIDTIKFYYKEGRVTYDTLRKGKTITISKSEIEAMCTCCFTFHFKVKSVFKAPRLIMVNDSIFKFYPDKYKVHPVKFDIVNGDTINFTDKFGFKQGRWNRRENEKYFPLHKKYEFFAFYVDDKVKTGDYKGFGRDGKVSSIKTQFDFNSSKEESFYENGAVRFLKVENDSNTIFMRFFENGSIDEISINRRGTSSQQQIYYENGKLKHFINQYTHHNYYPNGGLKDEMIYYENKTGYYRKYYHENGKLLAISKGGGQEGKRIVKYYNKKGKRVSKKFLIEQGYNEKDLP